MKTTLLAAVAALLPLAAHAHDGMHAEDAYIRSANPMTGAAFMVLENHREVPCTLTAVTSDVAERIELHTHEEQDGIMRMRRLETGIEVPAGETASLDRGGDHVMLLGLTRPLADGDTVTLALDFGTCGTEEVEAVVDNQRAGDDHGAHDHGAHDEHAGH